MNKIIAYFEWNGENFFISLIDKKKICFFKKDSKGELVNNFSQLEFKMMQKVYNSLKVDFDKAVFIKKAKINNNLYNLLYDKTSDNYFWTSNDGSYNEMDNLLLNFKYNHQPDILYSRGEVEQKNESPPKFYNKFVTFFNKLLLVCIAVDLSLCLLSGCTLIVPNAAETTVVTVENIETTAGANIDTDDVDTENTIQEKREYNWEDIRHAIESNYNLSEEEKKILISLKFVFDSDYQYMDLDMIIDRLRTLQILYGFTEEELKAGGTYTYSENIIRIAAPSFEESNIGVVIHEIGHSFQNPIGRSFLREWSNEKWTREVLYRLYNDDLIDKKLFLDSDYSKKRYENGELTFENDPDQFLDYCSDSFNYGYSTYIPIYCILADLLPQETLIYCHYNPACTDKIVDELLKIATLSEDRKPSNEDFIRAYGLLDCFNDLRSYDSTIDDYQYSSNLSQVLSQLDYYYTKAKGISINDNLEYHMLFSLVSHYAETGDYFENGFYNSNSFFKNKMLLEYGVYSFPHILLFKSYFGYSENSNNVLSFGSVTQEITDDFLTEFGEYINEISNKKTH